MNATGFSDDYNATFVGNESLDHSDVRHTGSIDHDAESVISWDTICLLKSVIVYVAVALGIPGNILSAISRHQQELISRLYRAVLAINDIL